MSLGVKLSLAILLFCILNASSGKAINILIVSENTHSACNREAAQIPDQLLSPDSATTKLSEENMLPQCGDNRIWRELKRKILRLRGVQEVSFVKFHIVGPSSGWLVDPDSVRNLKRIVGTGENGWIKFDYALWEGKIGVDEIQLRQYIGDVHKVIRFLSKNIFIEKWIISPSVRCNELSRINPKLAMWNPMFRQFPGPDLGKLAGGAQRPDCRLGDSDRQKLTEYWLSAITEADRKSDIYQKEALLFFFK